MSWDWSTSFGCFIGVFVTRLVCTANFRALREAHKRGWIRGFKQGRQCTEGEAKLDGYRVGYADAKEELRDRIAADRRLRVN